MTKKQLFLLLACTALTGFAATSAIAYDDYADRNRLPSVELNLGTLDNLHSQPTTQKNSASPFGSATPPPQHIQSEQKEPKKTSAKHKKQVNKNKKIVKNKADTTPEIKVTAEHPEPSPILVQVPTPPPAPVAVIKKAPEPVKPKIIPKIEPLPPVVKHTPPPVQTVIPAPLPPKLEIKPQPAPSKSEESPSFSKQFQTFIEGEERANEAMPMKAPKFEAPKLEAPIEKPIEQPVITKTITPPPIPQPQEKLAPLPPEVKPVPEIDPLKLTDSIPALPAKEAIKETPKAIPAPLPLPPQMPQKPDIKTDIKTEAIPDLPALPTLPEMPSAPPTLPPVALPAATLAPALAPAVKLPEPEVKKATEAQITPPALPEAPQAATSKTVADLQIVFKETETDVPISIAPKLDELAKKIGKNRVNIAAYAGGPETSGVYPKRVALARGIAVRNYLVSKGNIDVENINVKALGNKNEGGPSDRVDLFIAK